MSSVTIGVSHEKANEALANPSFREILSLGFIFDEIKEETGIDVFDYDSLQGFFYAYYSTLDTDVLQRYSNASANEPNETLEAVLRCRTMNAASV